MGFALATHSPQNRGKGSLHTRRSSHRGRTELVKINPEHDQGRNQGGKAVAMTKRTHINIHDLHPTRLPLLWLFLICRSRHSSRPTLSPTVHTFCCFTHSFFFFFPFPPYPSLRITSPKAQRLTLFMALGYTSLLPLFRPPLIRTPTY